MTRSRPLRLAVLALALVMTLAACTGVDDPNGTGDPGGTDTTTQAPEPTEAPQPTEAPETTEAPGTPETTAVEDEGEGIPPEALWIGLGILLLFLFIGWLMGRSRKSTPSPVASAPVVTWRDNARNGYSEARWLFDGLTEELALWRGNALYEGVTEPGSSAGTGLADRWSQLDDRMNTATDNLYQAEAAAPDQTSASTIRQVVTALNATRAAVDARAEARFNSRSVGEADQYGAAQAAERERLASGNLTEARRQLSEALTALSAIT